MSGVPDDESLRPVPATQSFPATEWSDVLTAGAGDSPQAAAALSGLCGQYWFPVYAYIRRTGQSPEAAQDLTQEFFARLVERRFIAGADPDKGRFRTFLLTILKRFLVNAWEHERAAKRGGGRELVSLDATAEEQYCLEPVDRMTADRLYDRRWAVALLETVMGRLRVEQEREGRAELFQELAAYLYGESPNASQEQIGARFNLSESAVKSAVHRLRARYRELLRIEVRRTLANPLDTENELRHLLDALRDA